MVKQNLGMLDRIFRFALAFWWLSPFAPNYSIYWMNWIVIIIGWIALLESFFGWCWIHKMLNINNKN